MSQQPPVQPRRRRIFFDRLLDALADSLVRQRGEAAEVGREAVAVQEKSSVWALATVTGVMVTSLLTVVAFAGAWNRVTGEQVPDAVVLSVVIIAAASVLVVVVATITVVFKRLGLANKHYAMALPDGSVRAIIALILIVLFFVASIFLYSDLSGQSGRGPDRVLQGLTAAQADALPLADVVTRSPRSVGGSTVYDVTLRGFAKEANSTAADLAKQLLTGLLTLVTAVAAFYFGANSVQAARDRPLPRERDGDGPDADGSGSGAIRRPADPQAPSAQAPTPQAPAGERGGGAETVPAHGGAASTVGGTPSSPTDVASAASPSSDVAPIDFELTPRTATPAPPSAAGSSAAPPREEPPRAASAGESLTW